MTYQETLETIKPELEKNFAEFKSELAKLRTGRLSPALVEDIEADCFGSLMPIKQLGAISSLGLREIVLQLWDRTYVDGVVKALEQEGLGLGVRVDDNNVYLTSPALTEDLRKNIVRVLDKTKEDFFQGQRHLRDKAWRVLQDQERAGELREDDKFKGRDKLDEMVRDFRDKMEQAALTKEREILG